MVPFVGATAASEPPQAGEGGGLSSHAALDVCMYGFLADRTAPSRVTGMSSILPV